MKDIYIRIKRDVLNEKDFEFVSELFKKDNVNTFGVETYEDYLNDIGIDTIANGYLYHIEGDEKPTYFKTIGEINKKYVFKILLATITPNWLTSFYSCVDRPYLGLWNSLEEFKEFYLENKEVCSIVNENGTPITYDDFLDLIYDPEHKDFLTKEKFNEKLEKFNNQLSILQSTEQTNEALVEQVMPLYDTVCGRIYYKSDNHIEGVPYQEETFVLEARELINGKTKEVIEDTESEEEEEE